MGTWSNFKNYILEKIGMHTLLQNSEASLKNELETIAAITFTNAIENCDWLKDKAFFPGGMAVEYTFLLTLYRILNHQRFNNILEFGLGQTSRMIHQYANYYKVQATTVEHDEQWVDFTKNDTKNTYPINIKLLPLNMVDYKGYSTRTYKDIETTFVNQKFDFILVDGPFGSEHFSRSQIIHLIQSNLSDTFCIILDDCERTGERETLNEIHNILREKAIQYSYTIYHGRKDHSVICSRDLKFLTSL